MLRAKKLCLRYNKTEVLRDLSFTVSPGETFCLLGKKESGKTTLINVFSGLLEPSSGEALIDQYAIQLNTIGNIIARVPDTVQIYGHLSGLENLDIFSRLAGFIYTKEGLRSLLKMVSLPEAAHKKRLVTYSEAMRIKFFMAFALAKKANFVLMDEPTKNLNAMESMEFFKTCRQLSYNGAGILMTTNNIDAAMAVGSKVGILDKGTLIYTANTSKIDTKEIQNLFSEPSQ